MPYHRTVGPVGIGAVIAVDMANQVEKIIFELYLIINIGMIAVVVWPVVGKLRPAVPCNQYYARIIHKAINALEV